MYIDDNCDNRVLIERFLGFEGFEVFSAETGREGLEQAAKILPDVFLIDVNLPDISGYEVVTELNRRQDTQGIPKILFTADDIELEPQKPDFDYFIQKPLDVNTMAEKIKRVIEHPPERNGISL
ncbi:MAG: response regulator [Anaerolineae bacterium]|nr:response regulator [Anaerolineae bacterium]